MESRAECIFPTDRRGELRHGFRMSVGAHPGGVGEVSSALAEFAEAHALPEDVRRSVSVALDDLLANALSHGQTGRDPCSVTVEVELDRERVTVIVTDDGPPFDPFARAAPDTTLSVEERPIGGLGIHLVGQLMDKVDYQRRDGHNVVVLVKELANG
jgi:serine/threonine-protein kinase RsbW